jgi:NADPH-dependent curcumin reductase CurA
LGQLIVKRARVEGFLVYDYAARFPEATQKLGQWLKDGKIHVQEDIVRGIDKAPMAFINMLNGKNLGKQLVQVAEL